MSEIDWDALPELNVQGVREAVAEVAIATPLLRAPELETRVRASGDDRPRIHLKPENLQVTGSFKVRGAAARMASLTHQERSRGVVACSSGNHGRAVAHVAGRLGIAATICLPEWVDPVKRDAMEEAGARILLAGATYDEAAERAGELCRERNAVFIHPFDDPRVVAGQGTIGLEILEELPDADTVVVPLSGGGLAGGLAWALKRTKPDVRVVAASARRARVMVESLRAGRPVRMEEVETLASALSGGIGRENRYTLDLVRELVDEHVLVEEEQIARAMIFAAERLHLVVEGGGAVGLAALLTGAVSAGVDGPLVVVLSGGNVGLDTLAGLHTT